MKLEKGKIVLVCVLVKSLVYLAIGTILDFNVVFNVTSNNSGQFINNNGSFYKKKRPKYQKVNFQDLNHQFYLLLA